MPTITIEPIDIRQADETTYAALNDHRNRFRQERDAQLPPIPLAEAIGDWHNTPAFVLMNHWVVWDSEHKTIAAAADAMRFPANAENPHLLQFMITVDPPYRRQGIGTALLRHIVALAQAENRSLLVSGSFSGIPAAASFLYRLGAKPALETTINQLDLDHLDKSLVQKWQAIGEKVGQRYDLSFWDGRYPEEDLNGLAHLYEVMNQAPRGAIESEDIHITPERLRQIEATELSGGTERWTVYVRERQTGELVGFSETFWRPFNPTMLLQGNSGVQPAHRGQGLGKWMKAMMLARVMRERPQVNYVRTGNANTNAPMLAINHALGFRPHLSQTVWQMDLAKLIPQIS